MENNENFVAEQVTENVEQTTEQTPKTYTEEEFNSKLDEVLGKKLARREAKIRKEYDRKYGQLEEVLKAGTGKETVEEVTDTFREFYQKKGIQFPQKPAYSDSDIEVLANAEAAEIIRGGYDEVVEEVDRLASLGVEKMTPREKRVFKTLAEHRQNAERKQALSQMGVTEDVYSSQEFKTFASKFSSTTPITEVFDIYRKTQPKKEHQTMGSMKNTDSTDNGVKDFYTPEEARRFTKKDFDENPALFAAVQDAMRKWKR
jgi:hypothetical protein